MAIINILAHHQHQQLPASPPMIIGRVHDHAHSTLTVCASVFVLLACVCLLKNISSQLSREAATITILVYKQIANELERIFQIDKIRK